MGRRGAIVLCLVFSGLTALVYQIIWTRLLGFAFGTTTEAIGTVLAVFFGGLALGNWLAARHLARVRHPLRVYAVLELAIGVFALLSLPLLRELGALYAWVGVDHSAALMTWIRLGAATAILLPPTLAMGATLPVVARGLVSEDATLGRWSALLYAANTLGAVCGAYLCGFWLIPELGLTRSVVAAGAVNLGVASAILATGAKRLAPAAGPPEPRVAAAAPRAFLAFFAVSGFVAIGYEIVWSKVFGIVMEGTLYGFSAVLSAYLLGIGLGSLAIAPFVDRIRDLPRAFGLLHVAIAASVALGMTAVPYLPFAHQRLAATLGAGDPLHLLFLLVVPIILLPTALFGAAFPVLIRIYTGRAHGVGRGMGIATAVNTAGSIAASLAIGFWWIPAIGVDASAYLLVLLDLGVALLVLAGFQASRGPARLRALAGSTLVLALFALSFGGVQIEKAIAGQRLRVSDFAEYRRELARASASQALVIEGRSSIVTIDVRPTSLLLRTNGLPEAGFNYAPPHYPFEAVALGLLPYLTAGSAERALVIGLGGGNTLNALRHTRLGAIEVVELERGVVEAMETLYAGRDQPLDDPRVSLRINDGRNELLLRSAAGGAGYDVIASQPSHPWRIGAADLFTEEFFRLARANLSETGRFALWVNGFRTDPESLLAVVASFERVFEGSLLFDIGGARSRTAFLLLGGRRPIEIDLAAVRRRMAEPAVAELLGQFGIDSVEALLARLEGPAAVFAAIAPEAANTDDNAFVETRIPRRLTWSNLDFAVIEEKLAPDAPVLPPLRGELDIGALARALLDAFDGAERWPHAAKLERLLRRHGHAVDPVERDTLRATARLRDPASESEALAALDALAEAHPARPEPLRARGMHLARRRSQFATAAEAFAEAYARSGSPVDAYDAGRALHRVDPERAWNWFERIPRPERASFPRLAYYQAARALERGARGDDLHSVYSSLRRYRDTEEGREFPGVDELLSRVAYAAGDETAARGFAEAASRERLRRGRPILARARAALDAGRIDEAVAALEKADLLLPANEQRIALRARIALQRGDRKALDDALGELRQWASSLGGAIAAENRFRSQHGLPLLPENSLDRLASDAAR